MQDLFFWWLILLKGMGLKFVMQWLSNFNFLIFSQRGCSMEQKVKFLGILKIKVKDLDEFYCLKLVVLGFVFVRVGFFLGLWDGVGKVSVVEDVRVFFGWYSWQSGEYIVFGRVQGICISFIVQFGFWELNVGIYFWGKRSRQGRGVRGRR